MIITDRKTEFRRGILLHGLFALLSLIVVIPILYMIAISFTSERAIVTEGYRLIPREFSTLAYEFILRRPEQLLSAYRVTILVTVIGTFLNTLVTSMVAFALARKDFKLRRVISFFIFFTLLFRGGLVPWYILISRYLNLRDTLAVLIIPYLANPWYVLLMRSFLYSVPTELYDSAKMDGANEFRIYFQIVVPLAKPALATIGLFYALLYWNDWWLGLLFIENQDLVSIQLMLHRVMTSIEVLMRNLRVIAAMNVNLSELPSESARMAITVLATLPMLLIFPFFQRYFVKGITLGSLKG